MQRIFLFAVLAAYAAPLFAAGVSGLPSRPSFQRIYTAGSISSTKSCAVGYTRITPNYCSKNTWTITLLVPGVCKTVARPASDAVSLDLHLSTGVLNNNSVGQKNSEIAVYTTNTCTIGLHAGANATGFEYVATTGGASIGNDTIIVNAPVDGSGNAYLMLVEDIAGTSIGYYSFIGYFD